MNTNTHFQFTELGNDNQSDDFLKHKAEAMRERTCCQQLAITTR